MTSQLVAGTSGDGANFRVAGVITSADIDWGALISPSLTTKVNWVVERMKSAVSALPLPAGQFATDELLELLELLAVLELIELDETLLVLDELELAPLGEALSPPPLPPPPHATNSPENRTATHFCATNLINLPRCFLISAPALVTGCSNSTERPPAPLTQIYVPKGRSRSCTRLQWKRAAARPFGDSLCRVVQ
ncbi:MAG: hypothetical protein QM803_06710 [Rhodocyclaceae bacterium]